MNNKIIFKRCERSEYNDFLSMINTAFGYGAENEWFQKNMSQCTPYEQMAADVEIKNHFIAVLSGKVIGAVGAYPFDLVVSENADGGEKINIKAFGIGQVSCLKEYRGGGVMSNLLKMAIHEMINEGAMLGFLSGDRFRYGVHGFDFGGNIVSFNIQRHRFHKLANTTGLVVKNAVISDCDLINEMLFKIPSYIKRSKRDWEKHMTRVQFQWFLGYQNDRKAYICVKDKKRIVEVQGDADVVKALILWQMEKENLSEIEVIYPEILYIKEEINNMLWQAAMYISKRPSELVSICDPDKLISLLSPLVVRHGYGDVLKTTDDNTKMQLIKTLFGCSSRPICKELSDINRNGIKPLVFWIPDVDNI